MTGLPYVKSYRELLVYQKARELSREIFKRTLPFPQEERYSLTDQIRRSSRSIGAQIAEAWAKRRYEKHFVSKLTDADGEQQETQHWIDVSLDCSYWSSSVAEPLQARCQEIGRLLGSMISKSELFCTDSSSARAVRESSAEYFVDLTEFFDSLPD